MDHEKVLRVEFFMKDRIDWRSRDGYWSYGKMVIGYREEVPREVVLSESELTEACATCPVGRERIPGLICGGMKYVNQMRNQLVAQFTLSGEALLPEGTAIKCGLDNEELQTMKDVPTMSEAVAQYTGGLPLAPFN